MEQAVIPLASIWPDPNNPRKDFGDLDALADTFELNTVRLFEPLNPPVVVPDGRKGGGLAYRLVDGERRYRAMVKRGAVEACMCIVCAIGEADAMAAMVATDDKERLTETELSRGVQQMLAVGVAPEQVDKAARLKKGTAARVKKVAADGTEQMSIAHLLAAEQFEGDDREAVLKAAEGDYERVARKIADDRKLRKQIAVLEAACEAAGVVLVDTNEEANAEGRSYFSAAGLAADFGAIWELMPEGTVGWICETAWRGPEVRFFKPKDTDESSEDAERNRRKKLVDDAMASRRAWVCGEMYREDFCERFYPLFDAASDGDGDGPNPYNWDVRSMVKDAGLEGRLVETGHIAQAFLNMNRSPLYHPYDEPSGNAGEWLRLGELMAQLGYVPASDEIEFSKLLRDLLDEREGEEEDGEDEGDE